MKINIKVIIVSLILFVLFYILFFDTISEKYSNYITIKDYTLSNPDKLDSDSNLNDCKEFCDKNETCTAYMVNNNTCFHTTKEINKNNLNYKKNNKIFVSICEPTYSTHEQLDKDTDTEPTQTPYKPPFVIPNTFCNNDNYDLDSCKILSRLCKQ